MGAGASAWPFNTGQMRGLAAARHPSGGWHCSEDTARLLTQGLQARVRGAARARRAPGLSAPPRRALRQARGAQPHAAAAAHALCGGLRTMARRVTGTLLAETAMRSNVAKGQSLCGKRPARAAAHRMRMQRTLLRLRRAGSRTRSAQVCCMPASCAPHPAPPRMQLHQHQQHARPDRSKRRMCGACAPRRATPRQRLPHAAPQQTWTRRAAQYIRPPAAAAGAAPHAAAAAAERAAAQWPAQRTPPLPIFTFLPGL